MSFTPSEQFAKRWLNSPTAMKTAIYNELDDIIKLLQDDTDVNTFEFTTEQLSDKLHDLQTAHLQTLKQLAKKLKEQKMQELLPILHNRIDDQLSEQITMLSDELKIWLQQMIKEELDKLDDD